MYVFIYLSYKIVWGGSTFWMPLEGSGSGMGLNRTVQERFKDIGNRRLLWHGSLPSA